MVKITKQQMGQAIKEWAYKEQVCSIAEEHCHDADGKCIPLIEDCEEHYYNCADGCHEECKCQEFDEVYDLECEEDECDGESCND